MDISVRTPVRLRFSQAEQHRLIQSLKRFLDAHRGSGGSADRQALSVRSILTLNDLAHHVIAADRERSRPLFVSTVSAMKRVVGNVV